MASLCTRGDPGWVLGAISSPKNVQKPAQAAQVVVGSPSLEVFSGEDVALGGMFTEHGGVGWGWGWVWQGRMLSHSELARS